MNLKESLKALLKLNAEIEDRELSGLISDILDVYQWEIVEEDDETE